MEGFNIYQNFHQHERMKIIYESNIKSKEVEKRWGRSESWKLHGKLKPPKKKKKKNLKGHTSKTGSNR